MANPRRTSYSNTSETPPPPPPPPPPPTNFLSLSSLIHFLRKPHAFPFLLSIFLLLTWGALRLQLLTQQLSSSSSLQSQDIQNLKRSSNGYGGDDDDDDVEANLVRYSSGVLSSRDNRGWLVNPLTAAFDSGLSGGALSCASVHVGQIRPGGLRGNHRHYTCNETFIIWGAETKFRLENPKVGKGYAQVTIGAEEVAVASSPNGRAHALMNVDPVRITYFLGCQDNVITYNSSTSDFNVWKDL